MGSHIFTVFIVVLGLHIATCQSCGAAGTLEVGETYTFTSPNYPNLYPANARCRWTISTPEDSIMNLNCAEFDVRRRTFGGCIDVFYFSPSGDLTSGDYRQTSYCGQGSLNINTTSNSFDSYFWSARFFNRNARGFQCVITVLGESIPTTPFPTTPIPSTFTTADIKSTIEQGTTSDVTDEESSASDDSDEKSTSDQSTTSDDESSCECGENSLQSRIVGGGETEVHEWPWQVALRFGSSGQQFCGGSLISNSWVLTAAHCVEDFSTSSFFVSIGEHDHTTGSDTSHTVHRNIIQKITHIGYDATRVINDIAVIKLSSPVDYSEGISPVCIPTNLRTQNFDGDNATVTGWGTTSFQGSASNVLLEVTLPVISNTECSRLNPFSVREDQLCTYEEGKDSCQGDSGGPLVWLDDNDHYQQIGIVSFGIGCADTDRPGVYTRITSFINWIEDNTDTNFCSP